MLYPLPKNVYSLCLVSTLAITTHPPRCCEDRARLVADKLITGHVYAQSHHTVAERAKGGGVCVGGGPCAHALWLPFREFFGGAYIDQSTADFPSFRSPDGRVDSQPPPATRLPDLLSQVLVPLVLEDAKVCLLKFR